MSQCEGELVNLGPLFRSSVEKNAARTTTGLRRVTHSSQMVCARVSASVWIHSSVALVSSGPSSSERFSLSEGLLLNYHDKVEITFRVRMTYAE